MGRSEHVNDPYAPRVTRIIPAAHTFVQDNDGAILMIQRSDNGLWALPGGTQDVGESIATTAERETLEETGYHVHVTELLGVYSDPQHVIAYDDGEVRQQFALCFRATLDAGTLATSEESPHVRWVPISALDDLPIHPSIRTRVNHALTHAEPHIG
jgi:8-oxo-dGTP pyrophosphatase MutT (NUDIX family)